MNRVKYKRLIDFSLSMIGIMILALSFNICYKPYNLVTSGVSGLSIIVNEISGIETSLFIAIVNVSLIILSVAALGLKSSIKTILGSLMFSLFVYLTKDASSALNLYFDEMAICLLVGGVTSGIGAGLSYKYGYSSGGTDVLTLLLSKYSKTPVGKSQLIINATVVVCGGLIFGAKMIIYALIVNYIESILIDKVGLGFSSTKKFIIRTEKSKEVKEYITNEMHSGVTLLHATGGFTRKRQELLMCTISSRGYIELKEKIREIDPSAFMVISECYEVYGGTKK